MLLYFAAPLFSRAERVFNEALTQRLEAQGLKVFLPQRDGVETNKAPYNAMYTRQPYFDPGTPTRKLTHSGNPVVPTRYAADLCL